MAGRSPVVAREEQRHELLTLSQSRERGEADRARALLLTLAGWTSPRIDAAGEFVGMPGTGAGQDIEAGMPCARGLYAALSCCQCQRSRPTQPGSANSPAASPEMLLANCLRSSGWVGRSG